MVAAIEKIFFSLISNGRCAWPFFLDLRQIAQYFCSSFFVGQVGAEITASPSSLSALSIFCSSSYSCLDGFQVSQSVSSLISDTDSLLTRVCGYDNEC